MGVVASPAFLAGPVVLAASLVWLPEAPVARPAGATGAAPVSASSAPATAPPAATPKTSAHPPPDVTIPPTRLPAVGVAPPSPSTSAPPPAIAAGSAFLSQIAAAPSGPAVPPEGEATAYGCGPALAYLAAYAAPGFALVCPGDAQGHQATTCDGEDPCAPGQKMIVIADPCPAAYMNEAHNSWAIQYGGAIDPYGYCRS